MQVTGTKLFLVWCFMGPVGVTKYQSLQNSTLGFLFIVQACMVCLSSQSWSLTSRVEDEIFAYMKFPHVDMLDPLIGISQFHCLKTLSTYACQGVVKKEIEKLHISSSVFGKYRTGKCRSEK